PWGEDRREAPRWGSCSNPLKDPHPKPLPTRDTMHLSQVHNSPHKGEGSRPSVRTQTLYSRNSSRHSPPAAAAVHVDGIGRHEGASVRTHKEHQLADFLGLAKPLHGHIVEKTLHQFRGRLRRALERRANGPRRNREATDAGPTQLARQ